MKPPFSAFVFGLRECHTGVMENALIDRSAPAMYLLVRFLHSFANLFDRAELIPRFALGLV
jgi:hypothetical protein